MGVEFKPHACPTCGHEVATAQMIRDWMVRQESRVKTRLNSWDCTERGLEHYLDTPAGREGKKHAEMKIKAARERGKRELELIVQVNLALEIGLKAGLS